MGDRAKWLLPLAALWLWSEPLDPYAWIPCVWIAARVAAVALALLPWIAPRSWLGWATLVAAVPWLTGAGQLAWSEATGAPLGPFFDAPFGESTGLGLAMMARGAEASFLLLSALAVVAVVGRRGTERPHRDVAAAAALGAIALHLLDPLLESSLPDDLALGPPRLPLVLALAALALAALRGVTRAALTRAATIALGAALAAHLAFEARLHCRWFGFTEWSPGGCVGPPWLHHEPYAAIPTLEALVAITFTIAAIAAVGWLARGRARAVLAPALCLLAVVATHDGAMLAVGRNVEAPAMAAPLAVDLPRARGEALYGEDRVELVLRADDTATRRSDEPGLLAVESGTRWGDLRRHLGPDARRWGLTFAVEVDEHDTDWRDRWRERLPYLAHAHPTPPYAQTTIPSCMQMSDARLVPLRIRAAGPLPHDAGGYPRAFAITIDDDVTIDRALAAIDALHTRACVR